MAGPVKKLVIGNKYPKARTSQSMSLFHRSSPKGQSNFTRATDGSECSQNLLGTIFRMCTDCLNVPTVYLHSEEEFES